MANKRTLSKDDLRLAIAKNIRTARANREPNMTQENVAQLFNPPLSRAAVAQWELGESLPDIDRLAVLSKAFGVTIDSLIFGDDALTAKDLPPEAARLARVWLTLKPKQRALFFSLLLTMAP